MSLISRSQNAPAGQEPLERARQAADRAAEELFDKAPAKALAQQDSVLENLRAVAKAAREAFESDADSLASEQPVRQADEVERQTARQTGQAAETADVQETVRQTAAPHNRDFLKEPWFAKLPPELREAIRNNARRRPPRAYEERMRRYFQVKD